MARRDPHLFFDRFTEVMRCVRSVASRAYASFDVGSAQAKFLRHIGQHGGSSQAELARATDTLPTLTGRVVDTMVERGWVRRKRSTVDRRQYVLELTAAGERVRKRVEAARGEVIARMGAALDDRDVADFERIAQKILGALAGHDEPGG